MTLAVGTRLGPHEIVAVLGVGGMGEVYRARDTRLGREVAIKVLPDAFARDAERLARFEREAKLLASLNHPGIAVLHGLEEADGTRFLVMELVEGETLAACVTGGPLPVEEALEFAGQIAEALEAAHENGVIHRDIKPANAKITPEGRVKVLDFGLAKAFSEEAPESDSSFSPTLSRDATRAGVILGTAAYMSPEQARGKRVDKRSDIFSFGALVYEMLSGRRAFPGEDVSDVLASVIKIEPDWSALPSSLHPRVREILEGCLEKDPRQRRRDIGDVRMEIHRVLAEPGRGKVEAKAGPTPTAGWTRTWRMVAATSLAAALITGAIVWSLRAPPAPRLVTRFAFVLEDQLTFTGRHAVALSPDGRRLVYSFNQQLYLREMDQWEVRPLRGTEGARNPIFSPDGEWVAYWAEGKLKKVPVLGGTPVTLCEAENPYGASWTPDGSIVFGQGPRGIFRVFANGGASQALVQLDSTKGETAQSPQILLDGKTLLFTLLAGGTWDEAQIVAQSLETGERRVLIEGGADARYVPTGHLVYAVAGTVLAMSFDPERLEVRGGPVPIVEGVARSPVTGAAQFSFSENGSLVYLPGSVQSQKLVWVDRKGMVEPLSAPERAYVRPRLSPDGQRLAVVIADDIWIYDISRGTSSRLTFEAANGSPLWTPDGKRIVFSSTRGGVDSLFWKAADGSGGAEQLTKATATHHLDSLSADGRFLAFHEHHSANQDDIWILPLDGKDGKSEPRAFLQTPFSEHASAFSPDGRRLAYVSNESGRNEVYVQPFPGPGGKIPISTNGGRAPLWSRDGREIFYVGGEGMMAVEIASGRGFTAGNPRSLFKEATNLALGSFWNYDVSPDGKRFITTQSTGAASPQLNVVLNWFEELKRLVPADG